MRADGNDAANSRFSQFWENSLKTDLHSTKAAAAEQLPVTFYIK